jgi:N-acetylneuraminic acid mutarotase
MLPAAAVLRPKGDEVVKKLALIMGMLLCVLALGVAACGGSSDSSSSTTDETVPGSSQGGGTGTTAEGQWAKLRAVGQLPPGRAFTTMAYDPTMRKLIIFGGGLETADLNDTWSYEPATGRWTDLAPSGKTPSARELSPLVYDPVSKRMYLFGGWDQVAEKDLGDTWCYDPVANNWTELDPSGKTPSGRDGHSLVYDPSGKRLLLFGGSEQDGTEMSDLWAYDPAANQWTQLAPSGSAPPARAWHSVALASSTGQMVIFGGAYGEEGSETYLNDIWSYDVAKNAWAKLDASGDLPSKRFNAGMEYDPESGLVFLYGGGGTTGAFQETWAFDLASNVWIELQPSTSPGSGLGHAMIYDPDTGQILLFGGVNMSDGEPANEIWAYNPAAAAPTLEGGLAAAPSKRGASCLVYDPVGKRVILFGGERFSYDDSVPSVELHDTWAFYPATNEWKELRPSGDLPPSRGSHAMVYDPVGKKVILFGGSTDTAGFDDTWSYDPAANKWTELDPSGERPTARDGHAMVYDPVGKKMIMFGGSDGASAVNETWAYDPAANKWTKLKPGGTAPAARAYHNMIYDQSAKKIIILGGTLNSSGDEASDAPLDAMWAYDPKANAWRPIETSGGDTPSARFMPGVAYDEVAKQLVLFGGADDVSYKDLSETWRYDTAKNSWAEFVPEDAIPMGRESQSMVYDPVNRKIIMFGGLRYSDSLGDFEFFNDIWTYDCSKNTWMEIIPATSDAIQASRPAAPPS